MANYRPAEPFTVPLFLYAPEYVTAKGSTKKTYPETGEKIFCSFRTFGGTEKFVNDVLTIEDTATVETWYRPDIKSDCIFEDVTGKRYEVLGCPENINMRNQIISVKIRAISGGA